MSCADACSSWKQLRPERQRLDAALRASETRYRRLFETAQDGILLLDAATGQITDVNPFMVKMLGYSRAEFVGKHLWEIGPFKDAALTILSRLLHESRRLYGAHNWSGVKPNFGSHVDSSSPVCVSARKKI
jgi:PAS domain-containing protein